MKAFQYLLLFKKPLIFFIAIIFLFFSCFLRKTSTTLQKYEVTQEEKLWLQEFFRDLLFNSPGAYTLCGTKPVSITNLVHLTEQDKQRLSEEYQLLPEKEKAKLIFKRYDFNSNYEKWEKIKTRFPITQYLFGIFPSPYEKNAELILFVNIEMTVRVLIDQYEDFRHFLGSDFDPIKVVFEVENKQSFFWNAILKNHVLLGILLGYDKSNSWFFEWNMKYENENNKKGAFIQSLPKKITEEKYMSNYDPQHFTLPTFIHFGLYTDEKVKKKYEKQRKKIKALYKGRDEVDLTLEWLTR
jgi:hypothetical protein